MGYLAKVGVAINNTDLKRHLESEATSWFALQCCQVVPDIPSSESFVDDEVFERDQGYKPSGNGERQVREPPVRL